MQEDSNGVDHSVYFFSKEINMDLRNYSVVEKTNAYRPVFLFSNLIF